jgi:hypothetical protein
MREARGGTRSRERRGAEASLGACAHDRCFTATASITLRVLRASACITFLAGCTTVATPPAAPQCIPLTAWTSAQQDEMRKEYDALPRDAILRAVFMDWVGMRDADRSCMNAGAK